MGGDVKWSIPVGLCVLTSSHPHLKSISGTRGAVLSKRFMLDLGGGGGCWGARGEASPVEVEAGSSSHKQNRYNKRVASKAAVSKLLPTRHAVAVNAAVVAAAVARERKAITSLLARKHITTVVITSGVGCRRICRVMAAGLVFTLPQVPYATPSIL